MQASDKSKEKYHLTGLLLIQYQTLQTNIIRILCQSVERTTHEILWVKGL